MGDQEDSTQEYMNKIEAHKKRQKAIAQKKEKKAQMKEALSGPKSRAPDIITRVHEYIKANPGLCLGVSWGLAILCLIISIVVMLPEKGKSQVVLFDVSSGLFEQVDVNTEADGKPYAIAVVYGPAANTNIPPGVSTSELSGMQMELAFLRRSTASGRQEVALFESGKLPDWVDMSSEQGREILCCADKFANKKLCR